MQLNQEEARVAVAALQVLDRQPAAELEVLPEPGYPLSPSIRNALDQHDTLSYLATKFATAGRHEVDEWERALTIRGLDRYVQLLSDSLEEDSDDFLLNPQRKSRESERCRAAKLLDKLNAVSEARAERAFGHVWM